MLDIFQGRKGVRRRNEGEGIIDNKEGVGMRLSSFVTGVQTLTWRTLRLKQIFKIPLPNNNHSRLKASSINCGSVIVQTRGRFGKRFHSATERTLASASVTSSCGRYFVTKCCFYKYSRGTHASFRQPESVEYHLNPWSLTPTKMEKDLWNSTRFEN